MAKCCDSKHHVLRDIVLSGGTLYATDQYVAVTYEENWVLPTYTADMIVPQAWVREYKPSCEVEVSEGGFKFSGTGKPVFEEIDDGRYPAKSIEKMLDGAEAAGSDDRFAFNPRLVKKVVDVFIAADIDFKVSNCGTFLALRGIRRSSDRAIAEACAIVMGKR